MLHVIFIIRAHHTERLLALETVELQSLAMGCTEIVVGALKIRLGQQSQNTVLLMLRIGEVNVQTLLAEE